MTEPRRGTPPELDRLELTVRRLLDAHNGWRRRAQSAEARVKELEAALDDVSTGRLDPVELSEQVERLEQQNRALLDRIGRAHAVTQRIAARLQFTEDER